MPHRLSARDLQELQDRLLRFCRALSRDDDRAADLCQGALLKLFERKDSCTLTDALPITRAIARNDFYADLRRHAQEVCSREDLTIETLSDLRGNFTMAAGYDAVYLRQVLRAIEAMPERNRQAMEMVAIEGHSYEEAAAQLDMAVGSVKSILARARNQLGARFGEPVFGLTAPRAG